MNLITCALFFLTHLLLASCETLLPLQCYVCNSQYQKCGQAGSDFDTTVQYTSPCYGYCVKINVYPGDFVIRTCTTLLANNVNNQSLSLTAITAQQCYLDKIYDMASKSTSQAYYCYCNDRLGCNHSPGLERQRSLGLVARILSLAVLSRVITEATTRLG